MGVLAGFSNLRKELFECFRSKRSARHGIGGQRRGDSESELPRALQETAQLVWDALPSFDQRFASGQAGGGEVLIHGWGGQKSIGLVQESGDSHSHTASRRQVAISGWPTSRA